MVKKEMMAPLLMTDKGAKACKKSFLHVCVPLCRMAVKWSARRGAGCVKNMSHLRKVHVCTTLTSGPITCIFSKVNSHPPKSCVYLPDFIIRIFLTVDFDPPACNGVGTF